jgi:hypothetical protein
MEESPILQVGQEISKKMLRMINQAKLRSFRTVVKYIYSYEIPRNYKDALRLDQENNNNKWHVATGIEKAQLDEYNTFNDLGLQDR